MSVSFVSNCSRHGEREREREMRRERERERDSRTLNSCKVCRNRVFLFRHTTAPELYADVSVPALDGRLFVSIIRTYSREQFASDAFGPTRMQ